MKSFLTNITRLKYYLERNRGITQAEAFTKLGITDLAGTIRNLKERGCIITTQWEQGINRYGDNCRFKRYFLLRS